MVIGVTGLLGAGKGTALSVFKSCIPSGTAKQFLYFNGDRKIANLLHMDTPSFNQLKENLGEEGWNRYQEKGICNAYITKKLFREPDDYKIFMDTIRPYMTCKLAKICGKYSDERIVVVFLNHLLDYEWADFCDRIVVINTPKSKRYRRIKKKGCRPTEKADYMNSLFLSEEEMMAKADWIVDGTNEETLENDFKKMMKDLFQFKKFIDAGMIPSPAKDTIQKCKEIINDCYQIYAPRMAAAVAAKKIAKNFGYDIDIVFTGKLAESRDVVGSPLKKGEVSELTLEYRERHKKALEKKAELRKQGILTYKQMAAIKREERNKKRREAEKERKKKEAAKRAEEKKQKERERQKRRKQNKKQNVQSQVPFNKQRVVITQNPQNSGTHSTGKPNGIHPNSNETRPKNNSRIIMNTQSYPTRTKPIHTNSSVPSKSTDIKKSTTKKDIDDKVSN